ncbi:MAG: beta strand repeat-containing protein [Halobacteriaceae archaeon]
MSPLSDSNDNNAYESGDSGAFFAQDAAMGDLSNGDQVVVDTAAQNPTITSPANVQYRQSSGTLNVSYSYQEKHPNAVWIQVDQGSDGGVKNDTYYRIDDSQYADDDTTKSLTIDLDDETGGASLGTGLHEISIHVKDSGGLTSTSGEKQVLYVDDVKPTNTGTFSAVDSSSTTTNVTLNGVSDADSGISLADTTITVTQGSNTWTLHGDDPGVVLKQNGDLVVDTENSSIGSFSEGDVTVDYDIVDKAGNVRKDTGNTFSINTQAPRIDTVEAEAGLSDVTVNFSEPVTAADAGISKDDFAYTDVSGDGVSQISSVSATTDQNGYTQTVTLTLDGDVQPSDLGSDEVNVRKGALVDRDSNNVKSTAATTVAVKDTFAPDVSAYTFVSAPDVNKNNVGGGYTVTVGVPQGSDHDQVKVTLTDENGNTTSAQNRVGDQKTSVDVSSFDFTKITDGQVDVSVTASDEGGMAGGTKTTSVTKDTVKPSVTSANVDPGEDTVRVTLDDWVSAGVNAFTTNNAPNVDNWQRVSRSASSTTYDVELASDLTVSQFNNGDVTAANVVDDVGNAAQGNPTSFTDDDAPSVQSIDAKNGSKTVTLTFSEPVFNKTDHAKSLSATNFSYNDVANGGAGAITGVSHTAGSDSVTLTLNASVTSADLGNDTVGFSDVVDVADKQVTGRTTLATGVDVQQLSVRASGSTVEVSFNATEELSAIDAGVSAEESIADDDTFGSQQTSWTLSMSDFSEAKMGGLYNYTATVEVPRDGNFQLDSLSVTDLKDNVANLFVGGKSAVVDQSTPEPVSAELKDDAEGDEVVVYFDEPVSSVVNPDTVSLEGDGSVTGADQIGVGAGSVHISVDQTYDTGASPNVTFTDGASAVTEEYGNDDTVADGAKTTVHTDVQVLDASGDGVNFVSVPAAAGELSISDIDAVDANSVEAIWTYDNGQWQSYRPDRSSGNDFTALQGGQGYVFKMKSTTTLAVNVHNVVGGSTRDAATPGARDLEEGWNLVGHWQEGDQPKATALSSVQTNYRTYGQVDGSTGYAYTTVGTFEPGESYWVFVKDDEVYTEAAW